MVFANVAGIEQTALREQANEFGSDKDANWVFPQQDYPDLFALGAKKAFGYFTTTWHYTLTDPGSQEFVQRFRKRWAGAPIEVPDNVSYNGYIATRELFRAIERAGTTRNHEVIKALEGHVIKDTFRKYPSTIREWDHLVGQMIFLARAKKEKDMKEKYDLIELIAEMAPSRGVAAARALEVQDAVARRHPGLRRVAGRGQALTSKQSPSSRRGRRRRGDGATLRPAANCMEVKA